MHFFCAKENSNRGGVEIAILLAAVAFSVMLAGGLFASKQQTPQQILCCDSGDGANCSIAKNAQQISYQGTTYDLLKSNVSLSNSGDNLKDSGAKTPQGDPIITNTSYQNNACQNNTNGDEQFADWRQGGTTPQCQLVPQGEIVFVCKQNCKPTSSTSYGDGTTIYDVYFRDADISSPGIPEFVQNCQGAMNSDEDTQIPNISNKEPNITLPVIKPHQGIELDAGTPGIPITQWLRPY